MNSLPEFTAALPSATHVHAFNFGAWRTRKELALTLFLDSDKGRTTWDLRGTPQGYRIDRHDMRKDTDGSFTDYTATSSGTIAGRTGLSSLISAILQRQEKDNGKGFDIFNA